MTTLIRESLAAAAILCVALTATAIENTQLPTNATGAGAPSANTPAVADASRAASR